MLQFYSGNGKMRSRSSKKIARLGALFTGLLCLFSFAAHAQTTLISPTVNNGGFESGATVWTFNQTTGGTTNDNRWEIGSVPTAASGTNAAYISTGATGLPWSYAHTSRVSYMYQDVTFPAGETSINLSYKWKGLGESTWDNLLVYLAPSTFTVSGLSLGSNSTTWTGATYLWRQANISTSAWSSTAYTTVNVPITATQAGNATASSTMRLIFVWRNDSGGGTSPGACVDDITLISSCSGVTAGSASPVSATGATLNWTALTGATGYNVRYKKVADPTTVTTWATPTVVTGGTTTSLNVTSLIASTQYEYQVSAIGACAVYSASSNFTTPCAPVPITQSQGFNATTLPACWSTTIVNNTTNSPAVTFVGTNTAVGATASGSLSPREGSHMVKFNAFDCQSGAQIRLGALPVSTTGTSSVDVAFLWYHDNTAYNTGAYLNEGVYVQYSLDGSTWTTVGGLIPRANSSVTTGWSQKSVTLPVAAGNASTLYVGFLFNSAYGNHCFMDSAVIVASPNCGAPTALTAAATSSTGATLTWGLPSAGITPSGYQYVVSTTNATPTGAGTNTTGSSVNVGSLAPNTTYYAYMRSWCGGSIYSVWTAAATFTTPCSSAGLPQFEGFNAAATIPSCWTTQVVTPPTNSTAPALTYETTLGNPSGTVREGARAVKFNSFNSQNSEIRLVSLPLTSVGASGVEVSYLWYNDNNTSYNAGTYLQEGVQVQYSLNGTTWTNAGNFVPRSNPTTGWVNQSVILPVAAANVSMLYVGFLFTSKYGNNCYMDSVYIKTVPPCSGTPAPGNTLTTNASVCQGTNFTLSLQNATSGMGVTYQWESSANGTAWSDINNATSATLTTSQTTATYYRCKVTCASSTGTSTAVQVTMTNFLTCYCTPPSTDCTWDDVINRVQMGTLLNLSTCGTNGYTDYSSTVAAPMFEWDNAHFCYVGVGNGGDEYVGVWIDFNQNGSFESSEYTYIGMGTNTILTSSVGTIYIPVTAKLGNTKMRVRVRYNATLTGTDACTGYTYGETEDYLVRIVPQTPLGTNSIQCGTATPTVSVSSRTGATNPVFAWYTVSTGGTPLPGQTGTTLSAYPISSTTTFYVAEVVDGVESVRKQVTANYNPQVSATVSASTNVTCYAGNNGTATVTASGGTSYNYSWNTTPVQTTATATGLVAGPYTVTVTNSNSTCPTTANVTITQPTAAASIPAISSHPANRTICANANTTFTAAATGLGITYQWQVNTGSGFGNITNGGVYSGATSATLTIAGATTGMTGYQYRVVASGTCSPAATSNSATLTVNATVPSVTTSATATAICPGTQVTFTATPVNGGTTPAYQWKVNGNPAGTNSNTFATTTLNNNDMVTVELTSNANCPTPPTVTSTAIDIIVYPITTPAVTIASGSGTTICAGTAVTFTATPVNGGSNPSYQWKKNGVNVGTNSATYTDAGLNTGNSITCVMTSSNPCPTSPTATSNALVMTVNPILVPTISITASTSTICSGSSATFTSTITNGGSNPVRTWKRNGITVASGASYTTTTLNNNDVVTCELTSSVPCPNPAIAVSNSITMVVHPIVTPFVGISSSVGNTICAGTTVTFTANPFNGGNAPTYQWKKNNLNIGTGSTYVTSTLAQGDVITCVLTTSAPCPTSPTATSNAITMTVNPILVPGIAIAASNDTICDGDPVVFTTNTINPGNNPQYQWRMNGVNISGANSSTYSNSNLVDGSAISCVLTSNALCVSPATTISNVIAMKVNPLLTPFVSISASTDTSICTGTTVLFTANSLNGGIVPGYQWKLNGANMQGATAGNFSLNNLNNGDVVSLDMTSTATCPVPAMVSANSIMFTVEPTTPPLIYISAAQGNKIKEGDKVTFSAVVLNAGNAPTYQWYKNDLPLAGATRGNYEASDLQNNDKIELVVFSSRECSNPDSGISNSVTIYYSTDVRELSMQPDVRLYPNPSNGRFTLEAKFATQFDDEHAKIEILNGVGQLIFKEQVEVYGGELKKQITLSGVANGIYYIRLTSGEQSAIKQINIMQQ